MSRLTFDGVQHRLALLDGDYNVIGSWDAYNNVDSHATMRCVNNGIYVIQDRTKPHLHPGDNIEGSYGSYGIIRFAYSGHPGVGIHSGRAHYPRTPGPQHVTMGCIRTTDEAMGKIKDYMATSPLTTIDVRNNSGPSPRDTQPSAQPRIYTLIRPQLI